MNRKKVSLAQSLQLKARRLILVFFLLSAFSFQLSADIEAPVVSAQELLENAEKYDGKTVIYKGEVIGDIMIRDEFAWINVRDETGALGVFCARGLVSAISHRGSYKFKGDMISVWGIFNRSCSQHGGDTDIHAEKITIIQKGEEILHPLESQKVKRSIILPAIVLVLAIVHLIIRRFR